MQYNVPSLSVQWQRSSFFLKWPGAGFIYITHGNYHSGPAPEFFKRGPPAQSGQRTKTVGRTWLSCRQKFETQLRALLATSYQGSKHVYIVVQGEVRITVQNK